MKKPKRICRYRRIASDEKRALLENLAFLKDIRGRLRRGKVAAAAFEAESIIRHFGRLDRIDFFTGRRRLSTSTCRAIRRVVRKRVRGYPLGYLLREADFYGNSFVVDSRVLIPRPETEIVVEEALIILEAKFPKGAACVAHVLDIGTGSGVLAVSLTIERPDCRMTALDCSARALAVAGRNLSCYGLSRKVTLIKSDLFAVFRRAKKGFWDLIVSNPPYIPHGEMSRLPREVKREPPIALDGGERGLKVIFQILEKAPYFLKKNGALAMEIGQGQAVLLRRWFAGQAIYKHLRFVKDLNGIDRVLILTK